jgi:hypothetical protein
MLRPVDYIDRTTTTNLYQYKIRCKRTFAPHNLRGFLQVACRVGVGATEGEGKQTETAKAEAVSISTI